MAELKPCPFCGDDVIEIVSEFNERLQNRYYRAYCYACGATTTGHLHREIAIARWNRRAKDEKPL